MDYAFETGIEKALRRIDGRLSPRVLAKESALGYLPLVRQELANIEQDFLQFMPDLVGHFKLASGVSPDGHWLR
jgi:hypothetical protein